MNTRDYGNMTGPGLASYTAEVQEGPPQPVMDQIGSRIAMLLELLGDSHAGLSSFGDRILGNNPRGVSGENAAKPNGVGAEVVARLDAANSMAREILDETRRINSGV